MTNEAYIQYLTNPLSLNNTSEMELLTLTAKYPYCQSAQLLLTINMLKNNKKDEYKKQLSLTAAYCIDRHTIKQKTEFILNPTEKFVAAKTPEKKIIKEIEPTIIAEEIKTTEIIPPNEKIETKKITIPEKIEIPAEKIILNPKEEIIEKFIKEQPKLNIPLPDKEIPEEEIDKDSLAENDDFVSETLALVYEKQRYYSKAIKIYEKLSLEFPEKSSFFASQIEKLKNSSNQQ
jgi:hypothetical protein